MLRIQGSTCDFSRLPTTVPGMCLRWTWSWPGPISCLKHPQRALPTDCSTSQRRPKSRPQESDSVSSTREGSTHWVSGKAELSPSTSITGRRPAAVVNKAVPQRLSCRLLKQCRNTYCSRVKVAIKITLTHRRKGVSGKEGDTAGVSEAQGLVTNLILFC